MTVAIVDEIYRHARHSTFRFLRVIISFAALIIFDDFLAAPMLAA